ncbi:MAG TPA: hypothetical protein DEV72_16440 [Ktedonobacter sp.]|jgi:hypothetical protein|nr:hypothetical protein [Ktedonobacter sp.]
MVVLLNIEVKCSHLRAKLVKVSGHLPSVKGHGKLAEGSDKLAPRIGFWAQDLDKKNFLRLRPLRERKFQGKKPKSFVHLLLEK